MDVRFVDTTFATARRACGRWTALRDDGPIAADMDAAGYHTIEVIANTIIFKKIVRDLKEDPWQTLRMLSHEDAQHPEDGDGRRRLRRRVPPVVQRLAMQMTADIVVPYRVQTTVNTADQLERQLPTQMPILRDLGFQVAFAVSYSISPRHTDEAFADQVRRCVPFAPDTIYLKDQGGLLTVDRIRTLIPIMFAEAGGIPIELQAEVSKMAGCKRQSTPGGNQVFETSRTAIASIKQAH